VERLLEKRRRVKEGLIEGTSVSRNGTCSGDLVIQGAVEASGWDALWQSTRFLVKCAKPTRCAVLRGGDGSLPSE
jgi:hypothetical protein